MRTGTCTDCGTEVVAGERGPVPKRCRRCRNKAREASAAGRSRRRRYRQSPKGRAANQQSWARHYAPIAAANAARRAERQRLRRDWTSDRIALLNHQRHTRLMKQAKAEADEVLYGLITQQEKDAKRRTIWPEKHVVLSLDASVTNGPSIGWHGGDRHTIGDFIAATWDEYPSLV